MNWFWCKPIDVIAFIVIIGGFVLMAFGINGTVKEMILIVTGFYFGVKTTLNKEE